MRNDPIDKLHRYAKDKQAWLDQAMLALGSDAADAAVLQQRVAHALEAAWRAGEAKMLPPQPADWHKVMHNKYVRPCYAIMRQAGQNPTGDATPPPLHRILRRPQ